MRPQVSIIPEPDKTPEARNRLTRTQRALLSLRQGGRCGCGCGFKLDQAREGITDEHGRPLELLGSNDLSNRSLYRRPCALLKTANEDLPRISKAKRQSGETGQQARRRRRGGGSIKSPGFGDKTRKFDGSVSLTARARRQSLTKELA